MQIRTLKIFCDVVFFHSFSQAAETNDVTQSTVSQCVHRLEKHLGAELIDRSIRPWRVTDIGRRCYDFCREILETYDRLEKEIGGFRVKTQSKLRIGSIYSVGFSYLTHCTERYQEVNSTDELYVEYLHPEIIVEHVLADKLDLGIVSFPSNRRELGVISCGEEELVVVCSPQHELARLPEISPGNLDGQEFVGFDQGLRISRKIKNSLKEIGVTQRIRMRFDNIEAIKRAVEGSMYLSILPRPTLDRELSIGSLCARPFAGARITRPLGVIHKKKRPLTSPFKDFINIFQDAVETNS